MGVGEVFVDLVEADQELLEAGRAGDDVREVPTAESTDNGPLTQFQKPNALFGSMPNSATFSRLVGDGDEVLLMASGVLLVEPSMAPLALSSSEQPGAGFASVGQGLQGGEGLGDDDEQGDAWSRPLVLLSQVVPGRC